MNILPDIAVTVKLKIPMWDDYPRLYAVTIKLKISVREDYPRLDGMPNVIRGLYKKETPWNVMMKAEVGMMSFEDGGRDEDAKHVGGC